MGTFEFALGELKCGRLPWFSWWVWAGVIVFMVAFVAGYGANLYARQIKKVLTENFFSKHQSIKKEFDSSYYSIYELPNQGGGDTFGKRIFS